MRAYFRSREKDGRSRYTIRSHLAKKHATCKFHHCVFYGAGVTDHRRLREKGYQYSNFFVIVTLNLTLWPSYTNMTGIVGRKTNVQIWTSHVKAFESYRLTYIPVHTNKQTDMWSKNHTHQLKTTYSMLEHNIFPWNIIINLTTIGKYSQLPPNSFHDARIKKILWRDCKH